MRCLTDDERAHIVSEALNWVGTPYKRRGKDRSGIDCSQLVVAIYRSVLGLSLVVDNNLPFLASWLFVGLRAILPEDLLVSDLVFYQRKSRSKGRIATSVAIYIGDGKVVHASGKLGKVAIEPIDGPGLLLTHKDPLVIEQWRNEIVELFPDLVG